MGVISKKRNFIVYASLLIFLILSLSINFFHKEKTPENSKDCPACHFQNSTLFTAQINFSQLPELSLIEFIKSCQITEYHNLIYTTPSSRSPPAVKSLKNFGQSF